MCKALSCHPEIQNVWNYLIQSDVLGGTQTLSIKTRHSGEKKQIPIHLTNFPFTVSLGFSLSSTTMVNSTRWLTRRGDGVWAMVSTRLVYQNKNLPLKHPHFKVVIITVVNTISLPFLLGGYKHFTINKHIFHHSLIVIIHI